MPSGLEHDRSFMIVNAQGKFLTQREHPQLSRIIPEIRSRVLHLSYQNRTLDVDLMTPGELVPVEIWKSRVKAGRLSSEVDDWLTDILGEPVTLVKHMPDTHRKKYIHPPFDQSLEITFTDGYPIHIVSQASIDDLSRRMNTKLDPLRFRPNMIVNGLKFYEEETLDTIEGKDFKLQVVKPAGRCKIPNVDPDTGQTDLNVLGELASYKKERSKVSFGVYAYALKCGEASVGEDLSICYK